MSADMPLSAWIILAVAGAILTVLGFLVRNAFETTTKTLEVLGGKLDTMGATIAKADGDRRVLERDVMALTQRLDKLERAVEELSEGVAR